MNKKYPALLSAMWAGPVLATSVFINEIHYDNVGTDTGEFVEIIAPEGTDLTGYSLVLYNGNNSQVYNTEELTGTVASLGNGFGTYSISFPSNGIQNGAPDGLALVSDTDEVIQFISYEGSFTAANGIANGLTSTDIGVAQTSSTPVGASLQLTGVGLEYDDFTWEVFEVNTQDALNTGQVFNSANAVFINEIHYDNSGSDVGEFVEVAGPAGVSLTGLSLVLYNGNNGTPYKTTELSGVLPDQDSGYGTLSFAISGIQNGAPDGIALVSSDGTVVQFLSYEGTMVATSGVAQGMESTDIGVSESGSSPVATSLQLGGTGTRYSDFSWQASAGETVGEVNLNQQFGAGDGDGGDNPGDDATFYFVHDIQGSTDTSPLDGQKVAIEAIVVGDFQRVDGTDGNLTGFYVQEEDADVDGDPLTSEGLFIYDGPSPAVDVNVGDKVYIVGTVDEFFGESQISVLGGSVEVVSSENTLPSAAVVSLPTATTLNADGELVVDLEAVEGMRIQVGQTLTVTELYNLDRFGEILLSSSGRQYQYTELNAPDAAGYAEHVATLAANRLMLDDGLSVQNPDPIRFPAPGLSTANAVRLSDEVTNLTGIVTYRRGSGGSGMQTYRIMPTIEPAFTRPVARQDKPDVGGRIQVASFNLLNFFNTLGRSCYLGGGTGDCRGADTNEEYARQLAKTVTTITQLDADVLGVVEVENDYVEGNASAIAELVSALNAAADPALCAEYGYVDPGQRVGTDAIAVGLLYCKDTMEVAAGSNVAILDDSDLEELGYSAYAPLFEGSSTNRAAIAVTFTEKSTAEQFTISVNHFKSKGGSGSGGNADAGDGAGAWNERRTQAAQVLHTWLATSPTGNADEDIVIVGDLNAYSMEDPLQELQNNGYISVMHDEPTYSYIFDGQAGNLDHGLVNESLFEQMIGAQVWHINSDEADALDYNLDFGRPADIFDGTTPYRTSDHDPLLIGFDLWSPLPGDWDGDDDVDQQDFVGLVRAIAKRQAIDLIFDLNGDNKVNMLDARILRSLCTRKACAVR